MRRCISALALLWAVSPLAAAPRELLRGTELRLSLLNGLSTSVSRDGDPFEAVVTQPVLLGTDLVLPAGTRVRGIVARVYHTRRFNLIRGQAALVLQFKALEVDGREIPVQMSLLSVERPEGNNHRRKDLKTEEGSIIEARPDVKGDVTAVAVGTGGGTLVGAVFGHVVRGLGLGLGGGAAYVLIRKGKEVELPAQTILVVRLDNSITLPATARRTAYSGGTP